jgi:hypothetical protein
MCIRLTSVATGGRQSHPVHALQDRAKQFYEHYGFQVSPAHPMTLAMRPPINSM